MNNSVMSIDTVIIDPEVLADAEAVVAAITTRTVVDPDIVRRVQARSQTIRDRVLREYGPVDVAVPAIRELRDE